MQAYRHDEICPISAPIALDAEPQRKLAAIMLAFALFGEASITTALRVNVRHVDDDIFRSHVVIRHLSAAQSIRGNQVRGDMKSGAPKGH